MFTVWERFYEPPTHTIVTFLQNARTSRSISPHMTVQHIRYLISSTPSESVDSNHNLALSVLWCAPLLFPLSYFPKCAPYKLPCPDTRHNHNYFQRTIRNQPTTAITVKSYLLQIKFFSSYIELQDFKLPLGRKPCGAELNRLLPGVPRSTSSYAITQVLLQK